MNKYNDLLIDYMRQKSVIVKMFSGIPLADDTELIELSMWSADDCRKALAELDSGSDASSCPWCIKHDLECDDCSYGDRNGVCDAGDSVYTKIRKAIKYRFLTDLPGIQKLIATTKQKFTEIESSEQK